MRDTLQAEGKNVTIRQALHCPEHKAVRPGITSFTDTLVSRELPNDSPWGRRRMDFRVEMDTQALISDRAVFVPSRGLRPGDSPATPWERTLRNERAAPQSHTRPLVANATGFGGHMHSQNPLSTAAPRSTRWRPALPPMKRESGSVTWSWPWGGLQHQPQGLAVGAVSRLNPVLVSTSSPGAARWRRRRRTASLRSLTFSFLRI